MKALYTKLFLTLFLMNVGLAAMALKPSREYKTMPEEYNMKYDKHDIPSTKGAKLHAWYFPCPTKTGAEKIVVFSTDGIGNMADDLEKVSRFLSNGFHVLIYDYRGFGKSTDFTINEDMYLYPEFADDYIAITDWVRNTKSPTFYGYGEGIGAGMTLGIGLHRKELIRIAVDSPFLSFEDLQKKYMTVDNIELKVPLAGYNKQYEPIFSLDAQPLRIDRVQVIVGELDKKMNEAEAKKLQLKNKKLITIRIIKGVESNMTFLNGKDEYIKGITDFFVAK